MLFEMPEVSNLTVSFWSVLVPAVVGFGFCAGVIIIAVGRSFARGQMSGVAELVGLVGKVSAALSPEGTVFIRGEYWTAAADEEISAGESVEVTEVVGMRLRVRRASRAN
jgi:membrane-bound serine protease (ClpP class)